MLGLRMAIEIHRLIFAKTQLADIPKTERSLLLLMGHATNEMNVLSKFILMMRKDDPPTQIEDFAEGGQIFIIMRILIGKLSTMHSALRHGFRKPIKTAASAPS